MMEEEPNSTVAIRKSKRKRANNEDEPPVQDREKKRATRGQTRTGKLAGMMSIPMDVLFEIFGHLRPLDLLHLARTTKEFRRLLMHRSASVIWKAVFDNIPGMPECPQDMSEPCWANLAFSQQCNVCLAPNIRSVDWRLRIRICARCSKDFFHELNGWEVTGFGAVAETMMLSRPGKRRSRLYRSDEYKAAMDQYLAIDDPASRRSFVEERRERRAEIEEHARRCEKWAASQAQDRSQELQEIRDSRRNAIVSHLEELGWGPEIAKMLPEDSLSNHKLVKNPVRLTTRIWSNIKPVLISYMQQMKVKRLAREHAALCIERKVFAVSVLRRYKSSNLPVREVMPEPVDFCSFPAIKAVLESPADVNIDESSFDHVLPSLPRIIDEWRTRVKHHLAKAMYDTTKPYNMGDWLTRYVNRIERCGEDMDTCDDPLDPEHLEELLARMPLATTVFWCTRCDSRSRTYIDSDDDSDDDPFDFFPHKSAKPLFYPRVMGHHCLTRDTSFTWLSFMKSGDVSRILPNLRERTKLSCLTLSVDMTYIPIVAAIVKACDLDPKVTTAEEMDELDPRLGCSECAKCDSEDAENCLLPVFSWRAAAKHNVDEHPSLVVYWRKLNGPEEANARMHAQTLKASNEDHLPPSYEDIIWSCFHCRDLPTECRLMTYKDMRNHLLTHHALEKAEPEENVDYFKDFAAPQVYATDVLPEPAECVAESLWVLQNAASIS